jgi:endo-1,4-beta-D-glucanase Y
MWTISRSFFLAVAAALALALGGLPGLAQDDPFAAEWAKYRDRFVTEDGRVLDTGNKEVSHTEGQGWAMLFAETAGDRAAFERIWNWTRSHLQRQDNALFAWRFDPADDKTPVADPNDASDGDILIAWALLRASRRWNEREYADAARRVVADIRRMLLVTTPGRRLVLLPGADGFKGEDRVTVVNPSYYVYPALKDFARLVPSPQWQRLRRDGLELLADARFGRWGLTPDWIDVDRRGDVQLAAKFPARFGFDAIRVPLYMIWGGEATPERLASYLDFWNEFGPKPIPAWTDLKDNSLAPYAVSTGFEAIIQLTRSIGQPNPPKLPTIGENDDYYSASLVLLAAIAQRERAR